MAGLTQKQISELQRRLRQRHTELRTEIRGELLAADDMRYADLAGRVHDSGEESVADLLSDLDVARIDRQVNEIRQTLSKNRGHRRCGTIDPAGDPNRGRQ